MRITTVEAIYPDYQHVAPSWRTDLWQIVVRIETDRGHTGYGYGGGGLASLQIINGHFRELLTGRSFDSPEEIASIWDHLYAESIPYGRKGIAVMALSGVDLALWDALGKAEGVPVCSLISGNGSNRKSNIRCYATGPDTEWHAELGYTGTKRPHRSTGNRAEGDDLAEWADNARSLFGPEGLLMIDTYMSWDYETTLAMAERLEEFNFHWFEDVLTPDHMEEQSALKDAIGDVNLAGGEHEFTVWGFRDLARSNSLDIWQPDITWCGGITAGIRIVDLARQHSVRVVPHRGGEVWGLHLIAATDCEELAEVVTGPRNGPTDVVWSGAPVPRDGFIDVLDRPGFGVELGGDIP